MPVEKRPGEERSLGGRSVAGRVVARDNSSFRRDMLIHSCVDRDVARRLGKQKIIKPRAVGGRGSRPWAFFDDDIRGDGQLWSAMGSDARSAAIGRDKSTN